ncbi:Laminin subunit beta-4 [Cichlidogyrus casuarinus]|uniref:Laminin subunit beta-4 n=1 Tax=Cichlidogyrus casuarinus TaxID=1844966 RepID=A0ABD2QFJ4_9PLAT
MKDAMGAELIPASEKPTKPSTPVEKCKCPENTEGNHCEKIDGRYWWAHGIDDSRGSIVVTDFATNDSSPSSFITVSEDLKECQCMDGSTECYYGTGRCKCKVKELIGPDCGQCKDPLFKPVFKEINGKQVITGCETCNCFSEGTQNCSKVNGRGEYQCICKSLYEGQLCNKCRANYFLTRDNKCEPCNCHPDGTDYANRQCDDFTGICKCAPGYLGKKCDKCEGGILDDNGKCKRELFIS